MIRTLRALQLTSFALLFAFISFGPCTPRWLHASAEATGLAGALIVACLLALLADPARRRWPASRDDAPLIVMLATFAGAAFAAQQMPEQSWRAYWHTAVLLAGAYWVGKSLMQAEHLRSHALAIALAMSSVVALYGIIEVVRGINPVYEAIPGNPYYPIYRQLGRPLSTQFGPAALATYLLAASFIGAGIVGGISTRGKTGVAVILVVNALCLLLTLSRGACVGVGLGLILAMALRGRIVAVAVGLLAGTALMATASYLPAPYERFGFFRVLGGGGFFAQDRGIRAEAAWAMGRDHPFFGVGFDHFQFNFDDYVTVAPELRGLGRTPDNMYLNFWSETGALGTLSFLLFLGALLVRGVRSCRANRDSPQAALLLGVTAGLLALSVNLVGYSALYWTSPCLLFGLMCGLVSGVPLARNS